MFIVKKQILQIACTIVFYELKANVADDWYEFFMESGVVDSMLGR